MYYLNRYINIPHVQDLHPRPEEVPARLAVDLGGYKTNTTNNNNINNA